MLRRYQRNFEAVRAKKPRLVSQFLLYIITDIHLRANVDGNEEHGCAGTESGRSYFAAHSKLRHFIEKVNEAVPDYVLCLGDMLDATASCPSDVSFFNTQWNNISGSISKDLTFGNHDLDDMTYTELVTALGYDNEPEIAESKFNKTFVVEKNGFEFRIIMLDTNWNADGTAHANTARGNVNQAGKDWVESVLNSMEEPLCLICSHHAPHYWDRPAAFPYFNEDSAFDLRDIVDDAIQNNSNLESVNHLSGHHHISGVQRIENLGPNYIGWRLPDSIEGRGNPSVSNGLIKVNFYEDHSFDLTTDHLVYPYPN